MTDTGNVLVFTLNVRFQNEVAWAVSLNSLGDLAARFSLLFMSNMLAKLGSHEIYIVGLIIAFGSRLGEWLQL